MAATPKPVRKKVKEILVRERKNVSNMPKHKAKSKIKAGKEKMKEVVKNVKSFTKGTGKY